MNDFFAFMQLYQPLLLDALVRGTVVLVFAACLTWILRKKSAATRHFIWSIAILAQVAMPVYAIWGPHWTMPVSRVGSGLLPDMPTRRDLAAREVAMRPPTQPQTDTLRVQNTDAAQSASTPAAGRAASLRKGNVPAASILALIWLAGCTLVLLRLVLGTLYVGLQMRNAKRVEDGEWLSLNERLCSVLRISRPVLLMESSRLAVPLTWGVLYPIVLLPINRDDWSDEQRKLVLVHELAHVKRFDALTQVIGQLALALMWFNPFIWFANRRMQLERESACDDFVLRLGTPASLYASELLEWVQGLQNASRWEAQPAFGALGMARRSEFEGRMTAILNPRVNRNELRGGQSVLGVVSALALVVPLAGIDPYHAEPLPCDPCQVVYETVATLTPPSGPRPRFDRYAQVRLGSNGRFYVSNSNWGKVDIFDSRGAYLRSAGGNGDVLGNLRASIAYHQLGVNDTLLVIDSEEWQHVFTPDGDFVRKARIPVEGWSMITLPDGRYVMQENIEGNPISGQPFHLFSGNGHLVRSFGNTGMIGKGADISAVSRNLSVGKHGEIVATAPNEYRIEQWDTTGHLVRVTEPKVPWFTPFAYNQFRNGEYQYPQLGEATMQGNIYWTLLGIPARDTTAPTDTSRRARLLHAMRKRLELMDLPLRFTTRMQAVDVQTGKVLASADFPRMVGALRDGLFYKRVGTDKELERIEIVRASLIQADKQP